MNISITPLIKSLRIFIRSVLDYPPFRLLFSIQKKTVTALIEKWNIFSLKFFEKNHLT